MENGMIKCKFCHTENPDTFKYCSNCGTELVQEPEEASEKASVFKNQASTFGKDLEIPYEEEPIYTGTVEGNQYSASSSPKNQVNGLAIASMICGIMSIVCCCFSFFSLVLGIAAVVLGILALNKGETGRGMAIAGIITGALGGVISLIAMVIVGASGVFTESITEIQNYL